MAAEVQGRLGRPGCGVEALPPRRRGRRRATAPLLAVALLPVRWAAAAASSSAGGNWTQGNASQGNASQGNASQGNAPEASAGSQRTTSLRPTTTTELWPLCPSKGCLPCPAHAVGRPDCRCEEGHTLTGLAELDGAGFPLLQPLPWDETNGWDAACLPVACGDAPALPHARRVSEAHLLSFGTPARYLCDTGYTADAMVRASSNATAGGVLDTERLVELRCLPDGNLSSSDALPHCIPRCGDGLLVAVDHLPLYDPREQCDDGNTADGDGCSAVCGVERGFVCSGGSPRQPDRCRQAEGVDAVLTLSITGRRAPPVDELGLATVVALASGLGCASRDLETMSVQSSLPDNSSENVTGSRYHGSRISAQISFRAKASEPSRLSLPEIRGALATPGVLLPRVELAFRERTSLRDLYVRAAELLLEEDGPGLSVGEAERRRVREEMLSWIVYVAPGIGYIFLIGVIVPWFYWLQRVRRRRRRLMGNYTYIHPAFKGKWAFNICSCLEQKAHCLGLVFLLPSRMADTWDTVGLVPYWSGVWQSLCCCLMYLVGCGLCGACIPGQRRSEMRDFFGFGDEVKGNLELSDYCCYVCCPLCCITQEARHADAAFASLGGSRDSYQDYELELNDDRRSSQTGSDLAMLPP